MKLTSVTINRVSFYRSKYDNKVKTRDIKIEIFNSLYFKDKLLVSLECVDQGSEKKESVHLVGGCDMPSTQVYST